jgi:hypothetical protein
MRMAVSTILRPWNSGRTIQPISDIGLPAFSCDHSATKLATAPATLPSGMIILIHAVSAAARRASRATIAVIPSGQRAAEFSPHDRIAAHPDVGTDLARFNVTAPCAFLARSSSAPASGIRHAACACPARCATLSLESAGLSSCATCLRAHSTADQRGAPARLPGRRRGSRHPASSFHYE